MKKRVLDIVMVIERCNGELWARTTGKYAGVFTWGRDEFHLEKNAREAMALFFDGECLKFKIQFEYDLRTTRKRIFGDLGMLK